MSRRPHPPTRPASWAGPLVVITVVVAVLLVGVWRGGVLGAAMVGLVALVAGWLLARSWHRLDVRLRAFRAGAVVLAAAVSVSLLLR